MRFVPAPRFWSHPPPTTSPLKRQTPIASASPSPDEGQNENSACHLHGPDLVQRPQVQPKRIVGTVRLLLAVDMRLGKHLWMVNLRRNWQAGRETSGRPKSLKQLQVRGVRASAKIQKALSPGNAMASTSPLHTQPGLQEYAWQNLYGLAFSTRKITWWPHVKNEQSPSPPILLHAIATASWSKAPPEIITLPLLNSSI